MDDAGEGGAREDVLGTTGGEDVPPGGKEAATRLMRAIAVRRGFVHSDELKLFGEDSSSGGTGALDLPVLGDARADQVRVALPEACDLQALLGAASEALKEYTREVEEQEFELLDRLVRSWEEDGTGHLPIGEPAKTVVHRLLMGNLLFIEGIRRKWHRERPELTADDAFVQGLMGLLRSVEKFDSSRGTRLTTPGAWWIRQSLSRAAINCRTIRLPVHVTEHFRDGYQLIEEFILERERSPDCDERRSIARACDGNIPERIFASSRGVGPHWPRGGNVGTYLDTLRDPLVERGPIQIGDSETVSVHEFIGAFFEALDYTLDMSKKKDRRYREMFIDRLGLFGRKARSLAEIGDDHGVSRERVRQIEAKVLDRLLRAQHCRLEKLWSKLDRAHDHV